MAAQADSELARVARRAVALQPAAEAFVQACRLGSEPLGLLLGEGRWIAAAYRGLLGDVRAAGRRDAVAEELTAVLGEHLDLVTAVLGVATGAPGGQRSQGPMAGLGRPAGRLIALRDRLHRGEGLGGRPVSDVSTGGWL